MNYENLARGSVTCTEISREGRCTRNRDKGTIRRSRSVIRSVETECAKTLWPSCSIISRNLQTKGRGRE